MNWELRSLTAGDVEAVYQLHVAAADGPGLARYPDELSVEYVSQFVSKALRDGIAIGLFDGPQLCGEIHA